MDIETIFTQGKEIKKGERPVKELHGLELKLAKKILKEAKDEMERNQNNRKTKHLQIYQS